MHSANQRSRQDPGRHHCQKRPEVFLPCSGEKSKGAQVLSPDIKRKIYDLNVFLTFSPFRDPRVDRQAWHNAVAAVSLSYVSEENTLCGCSGGSLTWLDEAGAEVQEDLHHRIKQESPCDITLAVTFQTPGKRKLRCQATVEEQVRTSAEMWVKVPGVCDRSWPAGLRVFTVIIDTCDFSL